MFITTSNNKDILARFPNFRTWPGPFILLLLPDHGLTDKEISKVEKRFVIFKFVTLPSCHFSAVRHVMIHGRFIPDYLQTPMLFADKAIASSVLKDLAAMTREQPFAVKDGYFSDGSLEHLALGSEIVKNPLFAVFFRNLMPDIEDEHVEDAIETIRHHLVLKEIPE